ncbi:DUF4191 domain-containing protein [Ornithinicoccus hortensis]|uniref:Uncharacterized protein DUF4191 n=1 Tax=Ornithinicoccus hortensis TaxID=82346 RepID=A0A542YRN2_9MICO|nr:DUF4191 domain-containing protein [Ornithinicoccus hortensis]TQL50584.1 uncharacterized protein DUF4191 [Ornithinicoccus hortensis]
MSSNTDASAPETKRGLFRRKKKVKDPNNPGRIAQFRQVFAMTRKQDPSAVWWMALAFLVVMLAALLVGIWLDLVIYVMILGVPLAVLAALAVLARKAERAAFAQIEGQPGAVGAVLGSLRRGWFYDQEPVAAEAGGKMRGMRDLHNAAMIYRAVGRPGVVLISEGPKGAALKLSQSEKRRVSRVVGAEVPVHLIRVGTGEDETRLSKMTKSMKKLDKKITKDEAIAVHQRLKALGVAKAAVPAGVDPRRARMDRRALRGR